MMVGMKLQMGGLQCTRQSPILRATAGRLVGGRMPRWFTFGNANEKDLSSSEKLLAPESGCQRLHRTRQRGIGERPFALSICGLLGRFPVIVESVQPLRRCKGRIRTRDLFADAHTKISHREIQLRPRGGKERSCETIRMNEETRP